jgi:inner membrane protein
MHRRGHYGLALLVFSPLAFLLNISHASEAAFIGVLIVVGVAPIPDIDQHIPVVSYRGITHTVWFIIASSTIATAVTWAAAVQGTQAVHGTLSTASIPNLILPALVVGFLVALGLTTHLIGDMMTPMGIKPFAPVSDTKYTWKLTTSGDSTANNGLFVAGLGATGAAIYIPRVLVTFGM